MLGGEVGGKSEGDPVNYNDPMGLARCSTVDVVEDQNGRRAQVYCVSAYGTQETQTWISVDSRNPVAIARDAERSIGRDLDQLENDISWSQVPSAVARAIQALTLNEGCMGLFGTAATRAGRFNPVTVITHMFLDRDNEYGTVSFDYVSPDVAITRPAGLLLPDFRTGVTGSRANTRINPAHWNVGNVGSNAETILHELGHLYNFTRGSGGFAVGNAAELRDPYAFDSRLKQD